jgi:hypothetical protein
MNQPDRNKSNYDRLWKIKTLFNQLSDIHAKFYSPSEHLIVVEVIVLLKGRVIFKTIYSKEM